LKAKLPSFITPVFLLHTTRRVFVVVFSSSLVWVVVTFSLSSVEHGEKVEKNQGQITFVCD